MGRREDGGAEDKQELGEGSDGIFIVWGIQICGQDSLGLSMTLTSNRFARGRRRW